jgi:RNA polymerase sigma-70 factor (ECF subfamily)
LPTIYSEDQLIALLRQRSQEGFAYLYRHYAGALFGVIKKVIADEETAQDVLQEAFVKIWNGFERYDQTKGRLYTWMLNICRNAAIDKMRSKGEIMRSKIQTGDDFVLINERNRTAETATDTIGIRKAVQTLKPEYQSIVELAYFKGYTMDEISKTLEVPIGTVKTRMRHAMQLLRQYFSN